MNSNYTFKKTMDFLLDYPWLEKIIINSSSQTSTQVNLPQKPSSEQPQSSPSQPVKN